MEELGLPEDRPRYDVKKRVLYGATSHFGKGSGPSGGGSSFPDSGSGGFTPSGGGGGMDEFPAPPTSFPDDSFDLPPPPPPPPMPFDDSTGLNAPFDDFPPPPPPPPADDFQF